MLFSKERETWREKGRDRERWVFFSGSQRTRCYSTPSLIVWKEWWRRHLIPHPSSLGQSTNYREIYLVKRQGEILREGFAV